MVISSEKRRSASSTYSKVVFLLVIVAIGFLLLFFSLYYYTLRQEKQIYDNTVIQYNNEINSLVNLNSESYSSVINDVTYWDEFVTFTKTKDLNWFNRSVANIIDAYKVDYLAAYTIDKEFITKVSTSKINTKSIISDEVFKVLYEKRQDKFYVKIPEGIVEVFASTIHPSDDPFKNKHNPSGYFFMMRLLDNDYFSNLEKISSSKISFYEPNQKLAKDLVYTIVPIKGYDGSEVAKLLFNRIYKVDFSITKRILLIILIAFIVSLLIFNFYAVKWSKLPITLIKKVLETGDEKAINSLKNIRGEFRYIGKLFEQNQIQKLLLQKEKERAEESDKLKSAFLTNLSHEIRTPMNAIIGFSDLLDNHELTKEEEKEYRNIISKSGKKLVLIIDDLIEMSKIDTNQIEPKLTEFDLDECIEFVFDEMKNTIPANKKIEFKIEKSKNGFSGKIISDKTKLMQIITNLLSNAIKFTDVGSVVLFYEVDVQSEQIKIYVIDTGIGIESKYYDSIFKKFRKIENDHSIRGGGLGLGLALTKGYVEILGGTIAVESEIGQGSTFSVTIPLISDKSQAISDELSNANPEKEKIETILVAEDDNFNYLLIEKILKLKKYKIIRAEDGAEAVEISLNNNNIDLILMDIKMPKMSGHEAFNEINKIRPNLPIIAQTAYTSTDEVEKIFKSGFSGYISKPINKEKLFELLNKYLK